MTVCFECGGPVDPDVTHIRHHPDCPRFEWGIGWDCTCGEVCAACCTDPGCPTRTPQETPMADAPIPLFAGTVVTWSPLDDGKGEVNLTGSPFRPPNPNDWGRVEVYPVGDVARLHATVEQTRRERDAADATVRKMLAGEYLIWDGTSWWWADNPDCDPDAYMASDETVDAIRRARAVPGAEEDQ